jgi:hypothetical protein
MSLYTPLFYKYQSVVLDLKNNMYIIFKKGRDEIMFNITPFVKVVTFENINKVIKISKNLTLTSVEELEDELKKRFIETTF